MSSWVMAVEVTPSELVAVQVDRASGADDGAPLPRSAPLEADGDAVDRLADAFSVLLEDAGRPGALVVATPADTERRRFEEIAEATALVGLPAPSWLPGPVATVGRRLAAAVEVGGRAVVLDARDGALTAWPVVRTADGAEVGARGPVATGTRLDQLLLGVVRAQLTSLDPTAHTVGGPRPGARGAGDTRGDAARLRREVRRARTRLAETDATEVRVSAGEHTVTVDRGVFEQLVEHALRETVSEIERSGPTGPGDDAADVLVLADRATPLARRLAGLVGDADSALVVAAGDDGVRGLAALLLPARPRSTRAASGAQAIRARRTVGTPSAPVGVGAAVGASGAAPALDEPPAPREPRTPPRGLPDVGDPVPDRPRPEPVHAEAVPAGPSSTPERPEESTAVDAPPVRDREGDPADHGDLVAEDAGQDLGVAEPVPGIPAARLPSTPVQAQRGSEGWPQAFGTGARAAGAAPALVAGGDRERVPNGVGGHATLAAARPHEARPTSDAPPGTSGPFGRPTDPEPAPSAATPGTGPVVRARRGPDTAPQPVAAATTAARPPRGAVPVLVVLLLVAVLAAVGVLVLGPDGISAAFGGLGAGAALLLSW
ncbi:hypothetical protein GCM10023201_37170 [Actinomycetospora corticicola]|uniref:Uncharacterized protein n=1 Tax=Actinomycetospora corticicola TaxID=663602 RepID=A0A7Y9DZ21_9PSEU|nr:hypothetical protein [Actinomycetospora corticicola]NYD38179.1 hypothetical protein [Actinomycetospora corticicola]